MESLNGINSASSAEAIHLDLLSPSSIVSCAKRITDLGIPLQSLILNAALYSPPENEPVKIGDESVNEVVVANVVGSAALLKLLRKSLEDGKGKVVWLGSQLHNRIKHDGRDCVSFAASL